MGFGHASYLKHTKTSCLNYLILPRIPSCYIQSCFLNYILICPCPCHHSDLYPGSPFSFFLYFDRSGRSDKHINKLFVEVIGPLLVWCTDSDLQYWHDIADLNSRKITISPSRYEWDNVRHNLFLIYFPTEMKRFLAWTWNINEDMHIFVFRIYNTVRAIIQCIALRIIFSH